MAGLNDKVPEGPQIRIEALALRDAVRRLREFTSQGAYDRRIVQQMAGAVTAQRVLQTRVDHVNLGRHLGLTCFVSAASARCWGASRRLEPASRRVFHRRAGEFTSRPSAVTSGSRAG